MTSSKRNGFYLKDSDLQIIRWLAEYRYLQPSHLRELSGRHIVSIRRRLRQLLDRRLVDRLLLPLLRARPINSPPDEYVYRLGRRGIEVARQDLGLGGLVFTNEKKVTFLEHDLMISSVHLQFELAARNSCVFSFQWRQSGLKDHAIGSGGERLSVNPDALFGVTDERRPLQSNTNYFFLEVERSRQHGYENGESAFIRKMQAYEIYAKQGKHRETWDFEDFRVLVIAPTGNRADNLRAKISQAVLMSNRFCVSEWTYWALDSGKSIDLWLSAIDGQSLA